MPEFLVGALMIAFVVALIDNRDMGATPWLARIINFLFYAMFVVPVVGVVTIVWGIGKFVFWIF